MSGKVYLVGSGPGDPELLTLKALRLLKSADVVLHDELTGPEILKLVPSSTLLRNVGKRGGRKDRALRKFGRAATNVGRAPLGLLAGFGVGLGARELVGIDNGASLLALAHMGVQVTRLLKRHPNRRAVAVGHSRRPQQQDIDPAIGNAAGPQRAHDPPLGMRRAPWLHPRPHALLKLVDDVMGDALIKIASHDVAL